MAAMVAALGRRGPDSTGTWVQGPCGLAHTRLSIIDVAGSPQPMQAPEHGVAFVYNGETYNYKALRQELEALGERFATNGDTEVIMRWLARSGPAALPKFDAMFAFGLWDERNQKLLLGRDALGEKPLFYATPTPGSIVFGSEIKAILAHPDVDRSLNMDAFRQALRFRAVYGAETLHRGVRQLEPGTYLEFDRNGLKIGRFFDLVQETATARAAQRGKSAEVLVREGRDLFLESVEQRLVADVPVGAFLSGGLDSSLIVAAMRKIRAPSEQIRTYSVGFSDDPHSELHFASLMAEAIGSQHQAINVGPEAYMKRFAELSACRDGPVSQPADIAIAEMSGIAKNDVKVVLSGEGADEVFAGYPKYSFAAAPGALRTLARVLGAGNLAGLAGMAGLDRRRALVAARALAEPREVDRHVQWFSYLDRADLHRILPGLDWSGANWERAIASQTEALGRVQDRDGLLRMQMLDCLTWLPGNMLERGDRMTMAEGLEVRPPFLDKELAAFGLALPAALKVRGATGKWIVRQWAKELVPDDIISRKKWGFRTPLKEWFRGPMKDFLIDHISASHGLCQEYADIAEVRKLVDDHVEGRIDAGETLWTILSAEVWYQNVYRPRQDEAQAAA